MPRNIRFPGCQRAGRPMFMPADAGQILRQMSGIRLLLHPAHHAAQFLADLFDQVLGLHTALCQEVDLAAALRAHLGQELGGEGGIMPFTFSLLPRSQEEYG